MERARAIGASLAEIEGVYREAAGRFVRLARAIVADEQDARDVVQEAMVHAVRQRESFRGVGPLEAWLWTAVLNAARTRRRARNPNNDAHATSLPSPDGEVERLGDVEAVRRAVSRLPERQRLVLFLRHYADLDYSEIASVLDIKPGTVGPTLAQAQATLRNLLGGGRP